LPVICSNCKNGTKEIILNGRGGSLLLVGNHKIIANKITAFFKNQKSLKKKLTLARNNIKKYTLKNNVKKYDKPFSKLQLAAVKIKILSFSYYLQTILQYFSIQLKCL
tara:strand:- start:614 stop:937 length:324 start_codon:yes stop_codon:yes gene_type:complete